ncbi:MAG: hypothetical protein CL916_07145 [Deltaproteobacteria bacterium]|nr:hypothetical protein [Deltaproteobacteria bacterium]
MYNKIYFYMTFLFSFITACTSSNDIESMKAEQKKEKIPEEQKMSDNKQEKIEKDLNSMSSEEIYKMVENNEHLTLSIPGDSIMGKRVDFTNEFVDQFTQKGRWVTGDTAKYKLSYENNGYRFEHKDPNSLQSSYVPLGVLSDQKPWAFEAKIHILSADPDANIGLLLGGNEQGDRFLFNINPSQKSYTLGTMHNKQWTILQKGSNRAIMQSDVYTLRAEYVRGRQQFFINNFFISGKEGTLDLLGDHFGFIIDGKASFLVEYVKISWS